MRKLIHHLLLFICIEFLSALNPAVVKYLSDGGNDTNNDGDDNDCSQIANPCLTFKAVKANQGFSERKIVIINNVTLRDRVTLFNLILTNGSSNSAVVVSERSPEQNLAYIVFSAQPVLVENLVIYYPANAGKSFLQANIDDAEGISFVNVEFRNSENVITTSYVLLIVGRGNFLFQNASFLNFVREEADTPNNILYPQGGVMTGFVEGNFTLQSCTFTNCGYINNHGGALFLSVYSNSSTASTSHGFLSILGNSIFTNISSSKGRGAAIFLDLSRINKSVDGDPPVDFNPFLFEVGTRFIGCTSVPLAESWRVRDTGVFIFTNAFSELLMVGNDSLGEGRILLDCENSVKDGATFVVAVAKLYDYTNDTWILPDGDNGGSDSSSNNRNGVKKMNDNNQTDGVYNALAEFSKVICGVDEPSDNNDNQHKSTSPSTFLVFIVLGIVLGVGVLFIIIFIIVRVARRRSTNEPQASSSGGEESGSMRSSGKGSNGTTAELYMSLNTQGEE